MKGDILFVNNVKGNRVCILLARFQVVGKPHFAQQSNSIFALKPQFMEESNERLDCRTSVRKSVKYRFSYGITTVERDPASNLSTSSTSLCASLRHPPFPQTKTPHYHNTNLYIGTQSLQIPMKSRLSKCNPPLLTPPHKGHNRQKETKQHSSKREPSPKIPHLLCKWEGKIPHYERKSS